jgi:hypothetical protein
MDTTQTNQSINNDNNDNNTQQQQQPHAPKNSKPTTTATVLDVSTYHGWDSLDMDTNFNVGTESSSSSSSTSSHVKVTKEIAEWDPKRKMIVKKVITTLVQQEPLSQSTPNTTSTQPVKLSTLTNPNNTSATTIPDFSYDGKNLKLKYAKDLKRAKVRAARHDPLSKYCRMCPICREHFGGHNSMVSHLLYREKCSKELDPNVQQALLRQKLRRQHLRLRRKMRRKHLPPYSDGDSDNYSDDEDDNDNNNTDDNVSTIDNLSGDENNDDDDDDNDADEEKETRDRPKKTTTKKVRPILQLHNKRPEVESERSRIYKEKMNQINLKYAAAASSTSSSSSSPSSLFSINNIHQSLKLPPPATATATAATASSTVTNSHPPTKTNSS